MARVRCLQRNTGLKSSLDSETQKIGRETGGESRGKAASFRKRKRVISGSPRWVLFPETMSRSLTTHSVRNSPGFPDWCWYTQVLWTCAPSQLSYFPSGTRKRAHLFPPVAANCTLGAAETMKE